MGSTARQGHHLWTIAAPPAAALLVAAQLLQLVEPASIPVLVLAAVLLGAAVFAAVHHAEVIAARIGEPFGSIVLAAAVTVIEVALIVSIMLASPESGVETARDTVFAAVMIVLNGIVGLCLLTGGIHHREQEFQVQGAGAALGVIGVLATLTMILPNYTVAVPGPVYAEPQLVFVAAASLLLYGLFLFAQTIRHRTYFLDERRPEGTPHPVPETRAALASAGLLLVALVSVVLLAETLTPVVRSSVAWAGLPAAFVGVVIAAVVLLPEGLSAFRAARANRLQTSLNLALGSAMASIGLTIPAVAVVSLILGTPLVLGLEPEHVVLLVLSLFAATLSLATGRTTILQGGVHLVIFGAFLTIAAVP
ncbi:ionic transporter y4hA [Paralimibaculum aggregatum]|uniref:Ionic transporter y4hA n=1 Tax=Paralimibaculum aggregatum TaxID=3036245 RepID=A0ABQ6LNV5_9RHOB|nr:calcium:proton antiporter [Limibaculum sp. NKW23]GMG84843.1 ionic transporter y4hA [Limibaculum sp. NKW23]